MVAGDKRRSAENLEQKNPGYLVNICLRANNTRDACLPATLFLTGRRISEVVGLKKSDVILTNEFLSVKTFNLKAYLSHQTKEFTLLRHDRYYSLIQVDVSRSTKAFQELGGFITDHLDTLNDQDYVFGRLKGEGHIGANMAWKVIVSLEPDVWPHWFRHQRFTQVYNIAKSHVTDPFDTVMVLHDFTHHRRIDTTMNYIHRLKLQEIKKEI